MADDFKHGGTVAEARHLVPLVSATTKASFSRNGYSAYFSLDCVPHGCHLGALPELTSVEAARLHNNVITPRN